MRTADGAEIGRPGDMIASEEDTHAADTDKDADNLGWMIAYMKEEKRKHNDKHNGPEVYELGGEDRSVSVSENCKVVPFDVKEG